MKTTRTPIAITIGLVLSMGSALAADIKPVPTGIEVLGEHGVQSHKPTITPATFMPAKGVAPTPVTPPARDDRGAAPSGEVPCTFPYVCNNGERLDGSIIIGEAWNGQPGAGGGGAYAIRIGQGAGGNADESVLVGSYGYMGGLFGTGLGNRINCAAQGCTTIGHQSSVLAPEGTGLGAYTYVGPNAFSSAAIASGSRATEPNVVSFGDGNSNFFRRLVNIDNGRTEHDASTYGQLQSVAAAFGGNAGWDGLGVFQQPTFLVTAGPGAGSYSTVYDAIAALDLTTGDLYQIVNNMCPSGGCK